VGRAKLEEHASGLWTAAGQADKELPKFLFILGAASNA
jgi:hypothetical protein